MKKFVLAVILCGGLAACNISELEFDNLEVQPISGIFAVSLGEITYTIDELLSEQNDTIEGLVRDSTSFLSLYYTEDLQYNNDNDFVEINDVDGGDTLNFTTQNPVTGVVLPIAQVFSKSYDSEGEEELDSVYYNQGELSLTVSSQAAGSLSYTITFANTINENNGQPVIFSGVINGPGTDTNTQDLADYFTRLEGVENTFTLTFDGELDLTGGETFNGDEVISYAFEYRNQTFDLVYGKFGQDSVDVGNEIVNVDFFEDTGESGLFLGAPVFRFTFQNSFGIPVATDFSGIYSEDEGGGRIFLDGNITSQTGLPEVAASDAPGNTVETVIEINRSNSTIANLLSNSPTTLGFDVRAISNYYDQTASNFVQPADEISALIEVEIPLEIRLENYEQSLGFGLSGGLDTAGIDSAFLRIVTINELPFSGSLRIAVQDSLGAEIFDRIENSNTPDADTIPLIPGDAVVFTAPFIDVNGFVTDPSGATADIPLSAKAVGALKNGSRIELIVTLNTPVSQTSRDILVKILGEYELAIKVGVGGRYTTDFSF